MIHTSVSNAKPKKKDGKYITSEFIGLTKFYILQDLFNIQQTFGAKFNDLIICLDKSVNGYWRKDVYNDYKIRRKMGRDVSEVNFGEVFAEIDELIEQLKLNAPWKVLAVPRAEADDIMLILAKEYCESEKILIYSPDKDMIQAQRNTDNVVQYSALTKKWITGDTKSEDMNAWIQEHCILGDSGDDVPKVVDFTEYSDAFLSFLRTYNLEFDTPMEFDASEHSDEIKNALFEKFDVYKTNRKGESTGFKDIYKNIRFGPSTLQKKIKEFGTVDNWLDSHPLYRPHYDRNYILVMEEGIPTYIREQTMEEFRTASTKYNDIEFAEYLTNNGLKSILMELPYNFKITRDLSADDFGW